MAYSTPPNQPEPQPSEQPGSVRLAWISESWRLFAAQSGQWIIALAISGGLTILIVIAVTIAAAIPIVMSTMSTMGTGTSFTPPPPSTSLAIDALVGLVMTVLQAIFMGGFMKMAIKCIRGETFQGSDVFSGYGVTIPMFVLLLLLFTPQVIFAIILELITPSTFEWSTLVLSIVVPMTVGFIVTAFTGVFILPAVALVADGVSLKDALGRSIRGMRKVTLPTFGVYLLFAIVYMASLIPCLLGTMVTVPMLFLLAAITARERAGLPRASAGFAAAVAGHQAIPGQWPPAPQALSPAQEPPREEQVNDVHSGSGDGAD